MGSHRMTISSTPILSAPLKPQTAIAKNPRISEPLFLALALYKATDSRYCRPLMAAVIAMPPEYKRGVRGMR